METVCDVVCVILLIISIIGIHGSVKNLMYQRKVEKLRKDRFLYRHWNI